MVAKVLLCGCGNIGFRHLQALCAMDLTARITVVEPFEGAHPRIRDLAEAEKKHQIELISALQKRPAEFDLAIFATNADTRKVAFLDTVSDHSVRTVIFEKILFQRVDAVEEVGNELRSRGIAGFVNCGRRGFPSYRALAATLEGPVDIEVTGGAFGLASNAIHFLDLAEYLNGAALTSITTDGLEPGSVDSKRPGFVELFGTLRATLDNGAALAVTCENADAMSIRIRLKSGDQIIEIDELGGTVTRNGQTEPFEVKYVSGMPYLYEDALSRGDPGLTPYSASARQHELYLNAVNAHLDLPVAPDTICPIS